MSMKERIIHSLKNFKEDPVTNLGILLILIIALTSVVGGFVALILFGNSGGFAKQIDVVKMDGIFECSPTFTYGNVAMLISGTVAKILLFLLVLEFITILINYFKYSGNAKRIMMIAALNVIFISIIVLSFMEVFGVLQGEGLNLVKYFYDYLLIFDCLTVNLKIALITYLAVVVAIITFLLLIMITAECRGMLGYTVLGFLFSCVGVPLFVLVIENIIPFIVSLVPFAILGVFVVIIFKIDLSGSSEGYEVPSISSNSQPESQKKIVKEEKYQRKKELWLDNTAFWVDENWMGYKCVYFKDNLGSPRNACTVYEFEKGEVAIYNKGKRIAVVHGCKTPER